MASGQVSPPHGFEDKRRGRVLTGTDNNAERTNMLSVSDMRTRLTALNAGYYTTARLDAMTVNDMLYALRDVAGI